MSGKRYKVLSLHGFLGFPSDFSFLEEDFELVSLDLSEFVNKSYERILDFVKNISNLDLIIGYSFGSRMGARLFFDLKEDNPKLKYIGLAGHLGILDKKQLEERIKVEEAFVNKLDLLSEDDFLDYWNDLSLFEHDKKLQKANFKNAKDYFLKFSLSTQPFLEKKLLDYSEKILFIYGQQDFKYREYAERSLRSYNVKFFEQCGHRVIQKQNLILSEVKEFLCQ